jgi:hypothetical protein
MSIRPSGLVLVFSSYSEAARCSSIDHNCHLDHATAGYLIINFSTSVRGSWSGLGKERRKVTRSEPVNLGRTAGSGSLIGLPPRPMMKLSPQ